jgi:antitoxin component of MazEF toxin-antitoxin module
MSLKRNLQKIGNSIGAIIPAALREMLGWEPGQEIEYVPNGNELLLRPVSQPQSDTEAIDLIGDVQ